MEHLVQHIRQPMCVVGGLVGVTVQEPAMHNIGEAGVPLPPS